MIRQALLTATLVLVTGCNESKRDAAGPAPDTSAVTIVTVGTGTHLISDARVRLLRQRGLADPIPTLVRDLRSHPEVIPLKGVEGGRMDFYDSTAIHVLDDHWVYATFDDGHIGGGGIFEYKIEPRGKIRWKVVKWYMD